jgi:zinc and cadmium transporter
MMSTLSMILLACLVGGILSVMAAALLAFRLPRRAVSMLVAFAAGVMLSSALLDILPEAFGQFPGGHEALFVTLLAGIMGFYFLEHLAIWRHAHPDGFSGDSCSSQGAVPLILIGDAFHNFVDGILIAAAFLADPWLGITTTLAVVLHEIPQELGDFAILLDAGWRRSHALIANAASSLSSVLGGLLAYLTLQTAEALIPYFLVIAASSFIYIAVADLMPLLRVYQRRDGFFPQSALIVLGIGIVPTVGHWLH